MNPLVGAGEAEEVRRPLSVFKRLYIFLHGVLVTFYTHLLEQVFDLVAILIPQGARPLLFGRLMQWLPIYGSERVLSRYNGRVESKNLVTKFLIGKGSSGIFYETTWLGCSSQGSQAVRRLARKDFPGVKGIIFEREVIPLFELPDHPNLLKTLCWTVDSRSCSLVTEYMRDDLSSVVRKKKEELRKNSKQAIASQSGMGRRPAAPFELHEALEIAIQIAIGMEYLHLKGITHGDLKANNIFIDWKEDKMLVKLTDFGLLETKRRSTMVSQRAFCFQMMEWSAPELFEDYFRSASEDLNYLWTKSPIGLETSTLSISTFEKYTEVSMKQADSYSFALICAFVLGGQMWNAKLSPSELRREISNSGLRPTLPSECPETLRSLISLCWDANPASRPTFSDILKELQEEQRNLQEDLSSLEPLLVPEEPLPSRESISSVLIQRENQELFSDLHENEDAFDDFQEKQDSYSYFYENDDAFDDFQENEDAYSLFYENPRSHVVDAVPENSRGHAVDAVPENPSLGRVVDAIPENRRGHVEAVNDLPNNPRDHVVDPVDSLLLEEIDCVRVELLFPGLQLD